MHMKGGALYDSKKESQLRADQRVFLPGNSGTVKANSRPERNIGQRSGTNDRVGQAEQDRNGERKLTSKPIRD